MSKPVSIRVTNEPSLDRGAESQVNTARKDLRIVSYYPRALIGDGGCTAAVRGWAGGLAQVGARVAVVSSLDGEAPPSTERLDWEQIRHRGIGRLRYPVGLEFFLQDADLLMLHSGWVYHNARAARAAQRTGVPYVITPHGAYDPNVFARHRALRQVWWRALEDRLLEGALAVHVSFEGERLLLERRYSGTVIVAPYGFAAPQLGHGHSRRGDYVLWMGRFDIQQKGIDILLHALARLPHDVRPRTRLHGPDFRGGKRATVNMIRQLGLERHVTVEPAIYGDDKWNALRECKLFVFSSRWDSNSVAALEAASAGVPIVATSTTFIGRALAEEEAAILVDADAGSMAAGILAASSPDAERVGARAKQVVREKFSWPSVANNFLRQLEKLL